MLVPARTLADAAKSLAAQRDDDDRAVHRGGTGEGIIGFSGATTAGQPGDDPSARRHFPPYRTLLPSDWASTAEVAVGPFIEAVKRVALVADRGTPVRLEFADGGVAVGRWRERGAGRGAARSRLRG